jgi:NADPH-dependent 2,4-dienoyl-CoA reductase/sulfur reductase-like enzyme/nitrite reductase/ring-hydroxylating ferredoxin subunit
MDEPATTRDLSSGIPLAELDNDAIIEGHVGDDEVIVVRRGDEIFAIGAHCTHYKGPLAQGLIVDDTVRCPWHHACFSLRTGEAIRAPAFDPVACWRTDRDGETVFVREKLSGRPPARALARDSSTLPESIVIVGGGAAGFAAAEILRREGYDRAITLLSADDSAPYDRPNLSKDYLAGTAQEDWMPLRGDDFYAGQRIDLRLGAEVTDLDIRDRTVHVKDRRYPFGALLIATGAEPVRLSVPGSDAGHVHYLRSMADSKAIIARAAGVKQAVVIGASFIGLEVAASLRAREVDVHVVAPEQRPMERILGPEVGAFVQQLHESHGVAFHLGRSVTRIDASGVVLDDGGTISAAMVVVGIGVRPRIALAERARLEIDRGIMVDQYLETSAPAIFAAGDVARWPDPHSGERIRVEHWVVAERQGQTAARNMLGARRPFDMVPFFWSQHYDVALNYVGHAEAWDAIDIDGSLDQHDCRITYRTHERTVAVATIFRDRESLESELAMEHARVPA